MYERFTDRARKCVTLARELAASRGDQFTDVGHLLLAVAQEGESTGAKAIAGVGFDPWRALEHIGDVQVVQTHHPMPEHTARLKKVFELSLREALQLGHNYVAPEHFVLAIVREGESDACELLARQDIELTALRSEVMDWLRMSTTTPAKRTITLSLTPSEYERMKVFVAQFQNTFGPLASTHPLERLAQAL